MSRDGEEGGAGGNRERKKREDIENSIGNTGEVGKLVYCNHINALLLGRINPLIGNNRSDHLFCKCWEAALKWGCLRAKEAPVMLLAIHILPGTEPSLAFAVFYLQKCYLASFSEILLDI